MCGIGGVYLPGGQIDPEGLQRMGRCMEARGPDAEGQFTNNDIGLIHRRLSILDLTPLGNCPMPNEDGSIRIMLNGEIYNWRELKTILIDCGHIFRSTTDSEVIAHGYEEWGEGLFSRLRGMFAIAIWDQQQSRLLLARDRIGEKPLFYRCIKGQTCFASTVNALLAYNGGKTDIDPNAIACFMSHNFIPATHTIWQGISVFPPAHYAIVSASGELSFKRYWSFPKERPPTLSVSDAEQKIVQVLEDSVRRCLDADVPVGVFLSGGVDSSVIAALAARNHAGIHSFSVGFDEVEYSELDFARKVSSHLGLEHHETIIKTKDVLKVLPRLVWHYGQPFGDASAVPTYMVSTFARKHVKVCLSGDGGDESFGGYWRVQSGVYAARYGTIIPESIRRTVIPIIAGLLGPVGKRLAAMNSLSFGTPGSGYTNSQSWHNTLADLAGSTMLPGLLHDRIACRTGHALDHENATVLQRLLYDDFQVQLPDAYLTKVDIASMAASLEVRAPLLDAEVLETAWKLPDCMKLHWGERKWLLKRIAAQLVPPDVVYRPKMGFSMPLSQWFKSELGDLLQLLLKTSVAEQNGWINVNCVMHELKDHQEGKRDNHTRLWLILWLELWFRIIYAGELEYNSDLSLLLENGN